jgi:hypothetical protein
MIGALGWQKLSQKSSKANIVEINHTLIFVEAVELRDVLPLYLWTSAFLMTMLSPFFIEVSVKSPHRVKSSFSWISFSIMTTLLCKCGARLQSCSCKCKKKV